MRRTGLILLTMMALLAVTFAPAFAVTDGEPDGNGHPFVGLMVAQDATGNPLWRCSGTLLSATVFLTAGHCTEAPAAHVEIWFNSGSPTPIPLAAGYPAAGSNRCAGITGYPCTGDVGGTPHPHPLYNPNAFYLHDAGVVALDDPMVMDTYGALPTVDQLDSMKTKRGQQDLTFTAVGYGLQASFPVAASWKDVAIRVRMVAHPKLIQINVPGFVGDFSLLLSNNANTGGTCFGDSGGPNFLGDSNVVAGVTSFGKNGNCAGTGGVFRMDRQNVLDFVNSFLN
jgi:hypothetical protein